MAKIQINSLPNGFEIKNGKIVKTTMKAGGAITGDQSNYGLVSSTSSLQKDANKQSGPDVRYSLSSVPRDEANLEAEGGESVLTDLNNDGSFGLYNITGPRHSKGGVPMYLPEQSFIYSDTDAMKFRGTELAEFGFESKKGITPAKISNKFNLNEFYAMAAEDPSDEIRNKSSELMLDKNKKALSKLAFAQESKKNFDNGVPVASYPYLVSQGIDPIEFTQRIEQTTQQAAQQKAIASLPPEQQQKLMMLQQMMSQMDSQSQQAPQPEQGMSESMGYEEFPEEQYMYGGSLDEYQKKGEVKPKPKNNVAWNPKDVEYFKEYGIDVNSLGVGETAYVDLQPTEEGAANQYGTVYGDASKNLAGWAESWKNIYPEADAMLASLKTFKPNKINASNPEVVKFQKWLNETYVPGKVQEIKTKAVNAGNKWNPTVEKTLTNQIIQRYGFNPTKTGKAYDGKVGTWTSSRRPLDYQAKPNDPEPVKETPSKKIDVPDFESTYRAPQYDFYAQDLLKAGAIANRDRRMFLPYQPAVQRTQMDYVLEDPTREIAANNEQFAIAANAAGSFGGPQQLAARTAQASGSTFEANANTLARVNSRNVGTINQGKQMNAQLERDFNRESNDRTVKQYDDTQLVLNRYMNEKNFDREQLADATANMITNAANTYNLNSIQPYYAIDPTTGGTIDLYNTRAFNPTKDYVDPEAQKSKRLKDLQDLMNIGIKAPNQAQLDYINGQAARKKDPYTAMFEQLQSDYQGIPVSKKGSEIKKYAVPFYTGKVGY